MDSQSQKSSSALKDDSGQTLILVGSQYVEYEGVWHNQASLQAVKDLCDHFKPRPDDIILASAMKTGSTWLKALVFDIASYKHSNIQSTEELLKQSNPHDLVPTLEAQCYGPAAYPGLADRLSEMPSPRLLHTHLPYHALPPSIKDSGCRIIYIARNPKDTFVSWWNFLKTFAGLGDISKEQVFDGFCSGVHLFGPFLEHVLSYWNQSRTKSSVLFLTYESLKAQTPSCVRMIADFVGINPSLGDDDIRHIIDRCSFESLSNLDVNKSGNLTQISRVQIARRSFFRRGEVGDWKNHFTPQMNDRLDLIIRDKLKTSGLQFTYESDNNGVAGFEP